jgi:UDP-2,3-diacylglucosamine hydrolase
MKRLRHFTGGRIIPPVSDERVVVVGDAHLGYAGSGDEEAFQEFLEAVPSLGTRLLVTGDLFDFWFEYRSVIPRRPFRTLARLAALKDRGVAIEVFGGNHDRWGGDFWEKDLGIPFHREGVDLALAGRKAWVHHGDGLVEQKLGGKIIHRVTRNPLTIMVFSLLHPTAGFWLADRLSGALSEGTKTGAVLDAAAEAQQRFARSVLAGRPELQLVLLAHTHRQRLVEMEPGRFYLNAGQWVRDRQYAIITPQEIRTLTWPAQP